MTAPACMHCASIAVLTNGRAVYAHRPDLWDKPIWRCEGCGAYVGCHPGTDTALGRPANAELRKARMHVHDKMDPIWKTADRHYSDVSAKQRGHLRRQARSRVYAFLAERLGLPIAQTHTGLFDLDMCRRAWRVLNGVDYPEIRAWAKAQTQVAA